MPPRPGDGDAGGEHVFVSYSHEDSAWVQQFAASAPGPPSWELRTGGDRPPAL